MIRRSVVLSIVLAALAPVALAVPPVRILGAGFETGDPPRDCAADALDEPALAEFVRTPDGSGLCVAPFFAAGLQVCGGVSSQCAGGGCFVPVLAGGGAVVDAVAGRVQLSDPLGQSMVRLDHPVLPDCVAMFQFTGVTLDLQYATATDGLDGVLLGGLAAAASAQLTAPISIGGCPGYAGELPQIAEQMRFRVLDAYSAATLSRIGEPLDIAVCPIVRP